MGEIIFAVCLVAVVGVVLFAAILADRADRRAGRRRGGDDGGTPFVFFDGGGPGDSCGDGSCGGGE